LNPITLSDACDYIEQLNKRRENVPSADYSLAEIRNAFFAFLGIKQTDVESQLAKMPIPVSRVTKDMMDAWYKAGMPSPPQKFFDEISLKAKRNFAEGKTKYGRFRRNHSKDRGCDQRTPDSPAPGSD
jgi:hypothetical protein